MNKPGKALHALAGHAIDLYRLARLDVFNPHSYSKFRTLKNVQRRTGAKVLIETGTFRGVTTRRCAPLFDRIYTIELDAGLAAEAKRYLAPYSHVTVIEGDATVEVARLLATGVIHDALVFLDGHFSGGGTALGDVPEPAADIMKLLSEHTSCLSGIVVDDFREFGTQPGWPAKWELVRAAEEKFAMHGFRLTVQLDQLLLERLA